MAQMKNDYEALVKFYEDEMNSNKVSKLLSSALLTVSLLKASVCISLLIKK